MTKVKIPDGWEIVKIGDVCSSIVPGRDKPKIFDGDIPWITITDIDGREIYDSKLSLAVSEEELKNCNGKIIPTNSIIMNCVGDFGIVAINKKPIVINQQLHAFIPSKKVIIEYILYALKSSTKIMERYATKTSVAYLNKDNCEKIPIALPPLDDQKKIAEILGTCDRTLELTQKLITAKRKLKQALMQKLLTGKLRFPEFVKSNKCQKYHFLSCPTDWKIYSIGEICREISNKNASPETTVLSCTKYDGLVPSLEYFGRKVYGDNLDKYKIVKRNQFAYATNHIEEGSIGLLKDLDIGLVSPIYTVFETKKSFVLPEYLILILKTEVYRKIFESLTLASVDRRGSLRWNGFSKIKVAIPNIDEQIKITKLFNKLTLEINCLEKKLFYLQEQKKGLMQQLLTGKIRVNQ